jgi:deazaflavin-dependent oxidoreductase (nitroreductase family)
VTNYVPSPTEWVADQVQRYEASDGAEGNDINGFSVVIVTHRGRKSGATRKTPLIRVPHGDGYLLVGSKGGAPTHPEWVYNLREDPRVTVQDRATKHELRAREVEGAEREQAWAVAVAVFPNYAEYQAGTDRQIPVFFAEPGS